MDDISIDGKNHASWQDQSSETAETPRFFDRVRKIKNDCSVMGFSLTSPDLVICAGSPDIDVNGLEEAPDFIKRACFRNPVELSPENSPYETDKEERVSVELFPENQSLHRNGISEAEHERETGKQFQKLPDHEGSQMEEQDLSNGSNQDEQREVRELRRAYESLCKEQEETKKALEESKREIEEKSKECSEAWNSVQRLQNELMRKSMYVGSLAYAVEGQVKEKSRWFSALKELSEKFKFLKMEHSKLSEEALQCRTCFIDINKMIATIQSAIERGTDLGRKHCSLKLKFIEEAKEKKQLYNKLLEMRGNIRVFCRCRPLNLEEIATGASIAVDFESAKDGELTVKSNGTAKKSFKFDYVFSPQADQADVFKEMAPFAASVMDGYNVCIFAYGQTGTGKTFTMEGTEQARGVNFRILEELFRIITERQGLYRYEISVGVLEVYNEQIRDLLASASQPGVAAKRLEIRQVGDGVHHVPGLVEAQVSNMNEVWEVLHTGSNARAVGSTNANEHSSRSHCIHCVMVRGENLMNEECTRSKLWLVDLAGSERVAKTDVQGERLKEAQNINKSLSALGDVIYALATKSPHIPFRNSKLTHLLQDSLGGDSKTLMFVQISPNENDVSETLCSLNFASRVRGIELGPAKKQIDNGELIRQKQMVEKTKQELKSKADYIKKMEENILGLELKMKARDMSNKNLLDRVKELESQLLIERKLARQHVDTKIAEHQQQQQQQATVEKLLPLGTRNTGNQRSPCESKDLANVIRPMPFTENNNKPSATPLMDILKNHRGATQKENRAELLPEEPISKRNSRASICPTGGRPQAIPAPRRNSLIPLPPRRNSFTPFPSIRSEGPVPPLDGPIGLARSPPRIPLLREEEEEMDEDAKENSPWSVGGLTSGSKFRSIFRRSIHKKLYIKSPLKGGVLGDMEKVRVSIGNGTRMTHRVLASNATKPTRGRQKQQHKEKERGWNHGITRNAL